MKELQQDIALEANLSTQRICIITEDIFGPIRNGGIGTAYFHLAVFLRRTGHKVTICFVNGLAKNPVKMRKTEKFFSNFGVDFFSVAPQVLAKTAMARTMAMPYAAYEWLKKYENNFDIIHVSEWRGMGYIALLAKKLGIAFQSIHFVVKGSSPTLWSAEGNQQFLNKERQLGWVFMERMSAEMADTLICGSKHLFQWMENNKYNLPERSYFWPNVFLDDLVASSKKKGKENSAVTREWVFFGRLEPRKGIVLFVNALNALSIKGALLPPITFLGSHSYRFDAKRLIEENQESWHTEVVFKSDLNAVQAIKYLSEAGRLAIIPALLENSPIAVYECLAAKIPFIAADAGGTGELLDQDYSDRILFKPNHIALAEKLEFHIKQLPVPGIKHQRLKQSLPTWEQWHGQQQSLSVEKIESDSRTPLVSICITHFERPDLLCQALESIEAQTYQDVEVIVVDDGSHSTGVAESIRALEDRYADKSWQFIYQENRYVGAARNTAARFSNGEYLLFFDDDNVMMPEMVEKLVRATIYADIDCLTCSSIRFIGNGKPNSDNSKLGSQIRFMGPAKAWATKVNIVGDATCLIKKEVFSTHDGYTERYRAGKDDIEFYNKLILAQAKISYYPDPLYYYRVSENSMKTRNHLQEEGDFRQISPYLQGLDAEEKSLLLLRQEPKEKNSQVNNNKSRDYKPGIMQKTIRKLRKFVRVKV
ncbi:glycosyltransferase [Microbulbifer sp. OS29]|uniref:Glycosyltransferase n=1 Tax=Microbulbifer okhotskensis TaxID=2926617 RepID=A0A9X2J590_9GAMM|nr:glycosyltransferase [Microbulbifer okhotskensis]MCO1335322.1 glycosyltransferase [Microbulbifer okhotskensis]